MTAIVWLGLASASVAGVLFNEITETQVVQGQSASAISALQAQEKDQQITNKNVQDDLRTINENQLQLMQFVGLHGEKISEASTSTQ